MSRRAFHDRCHAVPRAPVLLPSAQEAATAKVAREASGVPRVDLV
jgi:hypothetical protein